MLLHLILLLIESQDRLVSHMRLLLRKLRDADKTTYMLVKYHWEVEARKIDVQEHFVQLCCVFLWVRHVTKS